VAEPLGVRTSLSRPRFRTLPAFAVCALGLVCVFEALLLHNVAGTAVAPFFPRTYDQIQYLTESYRVYEAARSHGLVQGVLGSFLEPRVQGWLLQLQAGLLFLITGPQRLVALDLNIAYLLAFLVTGGALVYRRLGLGPALVFTGLVVSASTVPRLVGGLFDFRLDFAALCAWGMVVTVLAYSNGVGLRRWPAWLALVISGEVFITVRTLGFVYLVGTTVLLILATGMALAHEGKKHVTGTRRSLLSALAIWAITEIAFVAQNWELVRNYYVGGHFLTSDVVAQGPSFRLEELANAVGFYPRSVLVDHFGTVGQALLAATVAHGLVFVAWRRRTSSHSRRTTEDAFGLNLRWVSVVVAASLVVPYGALTLDPARSDVVGGILLPPIVLAATVALGVAAARSHAPAPLVHRGLVLFGVGCVLAACLTQAWGLLRRSPDLAVDGEAARASQLILTLADTALGRLGRPVVWSIDAHVDFGAIQVISVYYFEQRGVWPDLASGLGEAPPESFITPEEARTIAAGSDVLILTQTNGFSPPYAYDRSVAQAAPILRAVASESFDLVAQGSFYGRDVFGFIRRNRGQPL
jgi:hypothetical protein